jgi:hypothetical protein
MDAVREEKSRIWGKSGSFLEKGTWVTSGVAKVGGYAMWRRGI